jgi:hypothetical protein
MDRVDAGRNEHRKQDQRQEGDEGKHNSLTFSTQWGFVFDSERSAFAAFVPKAMSARAGQLRPQPTNLRPAFNAPLVAADKRHMVDPWQSETARTTRWSRSRRR